jgi:3-oxoacyl-[acyl-carrier protein] reductase
MWKSYTDTDNSLPGSLAADMDLELDGKLVLISGGSRGIGLAIAREFVQEGGSVVISARHLPDLISAQNAIGERCAIRQADAADASACAALIASIEEQWGKLDILVSCAGSSASVPPGEETAQEWQRVMAANLFAATNLIAAATPLLAKSASANIVCISSICGREVLGAPVTYSAAKSALDATVKGLSRPLAKLGIRINAVSPGNIFIPGGTWDRKLRQDRDAVDAMLLRDVPLQCLGRPEWIADAVCFLASSRAQFITGANLVVDGGQTRGL